MIKVVIFDIDGTLLDTIEDIHCALNESLRKFGIPEVSLDQTKSLVGNGARRLIDAVAGDRPPELVEELYAFYVKTFAECGNKRTKLYDGEEQVLYALRRAGIELAIVTNKPQHTMDNVYAQFLSNFGFCKVLGQTEYYPLKPDPASTLAIMDSLNVKKHECIFVGDGETDVLTAKAAGIKCISVLWGLRTKEQLLKVGADLFAEKFSDIADIVGIKNY